MDFTKKIVKIESIIKELEIENTIKDLENAWVLVRQEMDTIKDHRSKQYNILKTNYNTIVQAIAILIEVQKMIKNY